MTPQEKKIALMQTAATLTAISLPNGAKEQDVVTQHERWYQFLQRTALPDETVYTSPAAEAIMPGTPDQLQGLAKALAPLLAAIPGAAPAAAVANVIASAPLPTISASPAPKP